MKIPKIEELKDAIQDSFFQKLREPEGAAPCISFSNNRHRENYAQAAKAMRNLMQAVEDGRVKVVSVGQELGDDTSGTYFDDWCKIYDAIDVVLDDDDLAPECKSIDAYTSAIKAAPDELAKLWGDV